VWRAAYRGVFPEAFLDALDVADRERMWARNIAAGRAPLVVEEGAEIAGFAAVGPSRDPDATPGTGELYVINVAPEAWGGAHGRMLHDAAMEALAGFDTITLWVVEANARARRFYEKLGWQEDGVVKALTFAPGVRELRYRRAGRGPHAKRAG
jgi:ribosomal protein S18 acetylase RimI-like enzyme